MKHFILSRENALLIIIDVQERLAVVMERKDRVVTNCQHLIEAAKLLDIPLIVTEQYPKGLGPTIPEIRSVLPSYAPLEKIDFSCCGESSFIDKISYYGRKQIIVAGMETHVCVLQTTLDLLKEGYPVHVVDDAVCSRKDENYRTALDLMRDAGAVINCTETVLFQLLKRAGTDEFRTISKRIK